MTYHIQRTDRHGNSRLVLAYPDDAGVPLELNAEEAAEYVESYNHKARVRDSGATYVAVQADSE